jgi:hypothetical protein
VRRRPRLRLLVALAAALAASALLAGCIVFQAPPTASQQDLIGKVRTSFMICLSARNDDTPPGSDTGNEPDHPGCPDGGNDNNTLSSPSDGQALLGFRVPAGAAVPDSFQSTAGESVTLSRSPSYERQLEELVPPPAGQHWVGYISGVYHHDAGADDEPAKRASFTVDFGLPPGSQGGEPFRGPFRIRPVVGGRSVDPTDSADSSRPVSCGDQVFGGGTSGTDCIDSPDEATTATNIEVTTSDLGLAGPQVAGNPGRTLRIPFSAKLAGPAPGQPFALSAVSNLPGAVVAPSQGSLTAGPDNTSQLAVNVRVPARTQAGAYFVKLTATLPNGQQRSGLGAFRVRDKIAPVVRGLALAPTTFTPFPDTSSIAARRGTRVSYRLSETAKLRFTVQRRVKGRYRAVKGSFRHKSKKGVNRFHFTGFIRRRALRAGAYRLVGVPVDAAKNKGRAVRARFRIRR